MKLLVNMCSGQENGRRHELRLGPWLSGQLSVGQLLRAFSVVVAPLSLSVALVTPRRQTFASRKKWKERVFWILKLVWSVEWASSCEINFNCTLPLTQWQSGPAIWMDWSLLFHNVLHWMCYIPVCSASEQRECEMWSMAPFSSGMLSIAAFMLSTQIIQPDRKSETHHYLL